MTGVYMSETRLTKADMVKHLAAGMDMDKTEAERVVGILFREMERKLRQGCVVNVPGIGTLTPYSAQPKKGRNPRTGEVCEIPAQKKIRFRLAVALRKSLNNGR